MDGDGPRGTAGLEERLPVVRADEPFDARGDRDQHADAHQYPERVLKRVGERLAGQTTAERPPRDDPEVDTQRSGDEKRGNFEDSGGGRRTRAARGSSPSAAVAPSASPLNAIDESAGITNATPPNEVAIATDQLFPKKLSAAVGGR